MLLTLYSACACFPLCRQLEELTGIYPSCQLWNMQVIYTRNCWLPCSLLACAGANAFALQQTEECSGLPCAATWASCGQVVQSGSLASTAVEG